MSSVQTSNLVSTKYLLGKYLSSNYTQLFLILIHKYIIYIIYVRENSSISLSND